MAITPRQALFQSGKPPPILPGCVHYAGNEKFLRKAFTLQDERRGAFDVVCDLEDGAPRGGEGELLETFVRLLNERGPVHRIGARLHDPASAHFLGAAEALLSRVPFDLAFLTVPKIRDGSEAKAVCEQLAGVAVRTGRSCPPLHVLIETPRALRDVWEIAELEGIEALELGIMDFVSEHHGAIPDSAMESPGQFEHPLVVRAKCELSAAALGSGRVPTHSVTLDVRHPARAGEDARIARERFGFLRMWSIHPGQIGPILDAMSPTFGDVSLACEVLVRAEKAEWGPIEHGGKLFDRASYRSYYQTLRRAKVQGVTLPEAAVHILRD